MKFEVVVFVSVLLLFILRMLIYRILERKPKPLKNLICVVTGGAGEIGQVLTKILLEKGSIVIVWDVSETRIECMKMHLKSENLHTFKVDVSSFEEVQQTAKEVVAQFGGIDILINNAGVANPFDIEESSVNELQSSMNSNLMSHFWTIRTFLPYLRKSKVFDGLAGSVVAISSVLGGIGTGGLQTYCSSKAGIIGLMESLYMQHTDIHWCIVTPYLVNTHLFEGMRHRFMEYFYPILDKYEVASKIISAIEYQETFVSIPWLWNYCFILFKNVFPLSAMKMIENLFDVRVGYKLHQSRTSM